MLKLRPPKVPREASSLILRSDLALQEQIFKIRHTILAEIFAALWVQKIILGMQHPILGMASHDLCNAKTTILGATPGAIPGIDGNPHESFLSFAHEFSERFFKNWVFSRAPDNSLEHLFL